MGEYLRVVRKNKRRTRIELPDHTTVLIPTESLPLWDLVKSYELIKEDGVDPSSLINKKPKKEKKEPKPKIQKNKGTWAFRKTNGLGVDHPYETVNMLYTSVIYEDGIEAPF